MDAPSQPDTSISKTGEGAAFDRAELNNLLCSLSRELCRPLASLRTGFDLLLSGNSGVVTPEQQRHVVTMTTLCDALLKLTRNYLDYAELARGNQAPRLGTYSLGALMEDVERQFGSSARRRGLAFEATAERGDAKVVTDASRCQQIFARLVSNALLYTPAGGRVSVQAGVEPDGWGVLVEDDGPGIPVEFQEKVFDPFFRLERDESRAVDGDGLGLSFCRELAVQMGGRIRLTSRPGEGTTVAVSFPFKP